MISINATCVSFLEPTEHVPSLHSFSSMLQNCGKKRQLSDAKHTYTQICHNGLESHHAIENFLVPMFVECGGLFDAKQIFSKLMQPNEYSWSCLMQGYIDVGDFDGALQVFKTLQEYAISPGKYIYIAALKACVRLMLLELGQELHCEISKEEYEKDLFVGSTLVDLYAKCGLLAEAQNVLHELPIRDVVLWTTLLAGYTEHGFGEEALTCLEEMRHDGISLDDFAFVCGLKACISIGGLERGRVLATEIAVRGLKKDPVVVSALVDMYAKCGSLLEAQEVFDEMQVRDVVTWTALIGGYADHGLGEKAISCFKQMQEDGAVPDVITLACVLKACACVGAEEKGREINGQLCKYGLEADSFVGNMLVYMYAKCNLLSEAHLIFNRLAKKDVTTWNTLLSKYIDQELCEEVFSCLEQMRGEGTTPDEFTLLYISKACACMGEMDKGLYVHSEIVKLGYDGDQFIANTLVSMFTKCGAFCEAREVFDGLLVQDVISWNALIGGYVDSGLGEEALDCLDQMQLLGVSRDAITYVCSLKACGIMGAISKGRALHAELHNKESQEHPSSSNDSAWHIYGKYVSQIRVTLSTALIQMYGRCGSLPEAELVFNSISEKDIVLWNALLTAYALQGKRNSVFFLFAKLLGEGCIPSDVSFLAVLTACSHAGLFDQFWEYFNLMTRMYAIDPTVKHYNCLVDLLGRSGQLDETAAVLGETPMRADLALWSTVLGASRQWGNLEIGRQAFESAVRLDETHPATFVSIANLFADE